MIISSGQTEKFYLGPFTGLITLRSILTNDATNRYQVIFFEEIRFFRSFFLKDIFFLFEKWKFFQQFLSYLFNIFFLSQFFKMLYSEANTHCLEEFYWTGTYIILDIKLVGLHSLSSSMCLHVISLAPRGPLLLQWLSTFDEAISPQCLWTLLTSLELMLGLPSAPPSTPLLLLTGISWWALLCVYLK